MNMNKTYFPCGTDNEKPRWRIINAEGKVLGRLATEIAFALRGKDKAQFTPHADMGDYVVVINAKKVVLTGDKWEQKQYERYTGWIGGLKATAANNMPIDLLFERAVWGMLPKNKRSKQQLRKLKIYEGSEHPHAAQTERAV